MIALAVFSHSTSLSYKNLCAACILKAQILFRTSTSPWPPSCTGKYNTAARVQCCPFQKKLTIVLCIVETISSGGSITIVLCHKMEAARLFATRTLPRYDNCGNNHLHFDNRPDTFSIRPSQFFLWNCSFPKKTQNLWSIFFPLQPSWKLWTILKITNHKSLTFCPINLSRRSFFVKVNNIC